MIHILLVLICSYYGSIEAQRAILPKEWQKIAGTGFTTKWFKEIDGYEKWYRPQNIQDIYDKGFRNLRIRCRTGIPRLDINTFLPKLEKVVDECIKVGITPIVSWLNHEAEAVASDNDRKDYVNWWGQVAERLKRKDYTLAYNLFTELGDHGKCGGKCAKKNEKAKKRKYGKHFVCPTECGTSLRENQYKYDQWTREVVQKIRAIDPKRILILGSPGKTGDYLKNIPSDIYRGDNYMMAEWHIYGSGPSKKIIKMKRGKSKKTFKYWSGTGDEEGRAGKNKVDEALEHARKWTQQTGVRTYLGEWMPQDSLYDEISQEEADAFAKYFVTKLGDMGVPWSLNTLNIYYDTVNFKWYGVRTIKGQHRKITKDWSKLLDTIIDTMEIRRRKDEFNQASFYDDTYENFLIDTDSGEIYD